MKAGEVVTMVVLVSLMMTFVGAVGLIVLTGAS